MRTGVALRRARRRDAVLSAARLRFVAARLTHEASDDTCEHRGELSAQLVADLPERVQQAIRNWNRPSLDPDWERTSARTVEIRAAPADRPALRRRVGHAQLLLAVARPKVLATCVETQLTALGLQHLELDARRERRQDVLLAEQVLLERCRRARACDRQRGPGRRRSRERRLPSTIDTAQNRGAMPDADMSRWVKPVHRGGHRIPPLGRGAGRERRGGSGLWPCLRRPLWEGHRVARADRAYRNLPTRSPRRGVTGPPRALASERGERG